MFVFSGDKNALHDYIKSRASNKLTITDTPEAFLKDNGYKPIQGGHLKDGDIIVLHGPKGDHTAVICQDPKTSVAPAIKDSFRRRLWRI
jgi:hypothetical protein